MFFSNTNFVIMLCAIKMIVELISISFYRFLDY